MCRLRLALAVLLSALAAASVAGCAAETTDSSSSKSSDDSADSASESAPACNFKATDDCTPKVSMKKPVRVDAIVWRVTSVKTAKSIGDQTYGLGEKADGTFLIVGLKAKSRKDESVTLTNDVVRLQVGKKNTYEADLDGTLAITGAGSKTFLLEDIGPDSTVKGKVVFDVPSSALSKPMALRVNELGLGDTHAYIKLPRQ